MTCAELTDEECAKIYAIAHREVYETHIGGDVDASKIALVRAVHYILAHRAPDAIEPDFYKVWQVFKAAGYRYEQDTIDLVKLGYRIAQGYRPK